MKQSKIFILCVIVFQFLSTENNMLYAQCSCIGGAAVGGLTPVGGTVNIGVLRKNYFRASVFYRYSYGDTYYRKDAVSEKGLVDNYHIHYSGLLLGYGINNDLTIEAELGTFPRKYQDFNSYSLSGSGFSHMIISGKYNLYHSISNEFEISAGIGGKLPLAVQEENLPQHILSSTGAYGLTLNFFIHKGIKKEGIRFLLIHRTDINAENNNNYKYGSGFYTSFFTTKNIVKGVTGIIEIRNEYRLKDKYQDELYEDSGGNIFVISPQLNYVIGDFNISTLFDYPFYKYYNGHQLASDYSIAVNLTWQTKIY